MGCFVECIYVLWTRLKLVATTIASVKQNDNLQIQTRFLNYGFIFGCSYIKYSGKT